MNNAQKLLKNLLEPVLNDYESVTDEIIIEEANNLRFHPKIRELNDDQVNEVIEEYKYTHNITLEKGSQIVDEHHVKWFVKNKGNYSMEFWEAYKNHLRYDKHWSINSINKMDDISDDLVDLLGNPNGEHVIKRKGLIIGDVQSGKTANYIALMNKAVDVGFNIIILLTGTIEKLREQTQRRVDEGFIGLDSGAMAVRTNKGQNAIGVGKNGNIIRSKTPQSLTSTLQDFNNTTASGLVQNINNLSSPLVLVIKKNVKVLNNLNAWLEAGSLNNNDTINASLLLIDDESDYASVNTNKLDEEEQTATPTQILSLLNKFKNYSYVGFTATPFANIFIQPETDEEMLSPTSLFPSNYIYCLESPSNYIGAQKIFGNEEEADNSSMVVDLGDFDDITQIYPGCVEDILPMKHKKDAKVKELPDTLKEAIDCFFIANVVRDLRSDQNTHRTMMINMSRFKKVQEQLGDVVNEYLKEKQSEARLFGKLPYDEAKDHFKSILSNLKKYYGFLYEEYDNIEEIVIDRLNESIQPIKVEVVNSDSKTNKLSYEEYKNSGLRVIAIGGLGLSRGLTLEGLVISYFYRNSSTYDTLMQMGRWFGYRHKYEDLCKIWMPSKSIDWYKEIYESTELLKDEIRRYQNTEYTPKDFGLSVRQNKTALLVTARNKMRATEKHQLKPSFSSEIMETKFLCVSNDVLEQNKTIYDSLIKDLENYESVKMKTRFGYTNVDKGIVSKFLSGFNLPIQNIFVQTNIITSFINGGYKGDELLKWDICFVSGKSAQKVQVNEEIINKSLYSFKVRNTKSKVIQLSWASPKLGNNYDMEYGLSDEEISDLKSRLGKKTLTQADYFSKVTPVINRRPLLLVYNIELKNHEGDGVDIREKYMKNTNEKNLIGFVIGIPHLRDVDSRTVTYIVNSVAADQLFGEGDQEDEEEE